MNGFTNYVSQGTDFMKVAYSSLFLSKSFHLPEINSCKSSLHLMETFRGLIDSAVLKNF